MKAKLTQIRSSHPHAGARPMICFIPGGPGLSSATLRSMDVLARSFNISYVDTPGSGEQEEAANPTFDSVVSAIEATLMELKGPLILCGHSFGALFCAQLAQRNRLELGGLIAIATPFSAAAYAVAVQQYFKYMTPELSAADVEWERNPSRETLTRLLSSYGLLYFSPATVERGKRLLTADLVSWKTFEQVLPVLSQGAPKIDFVEMLRLLSIPKYFIAGELDLMLPPATLETDARMIGAEFRLVAGAGHFVTFDQPDAVAGLIEELIIDSKKDDV
ncbi:alpha/beta hydrolase [Bdellovibrionota bacterium FG-1]